MEAALARRDEDYEFHWNGSTHLKLSHRLLKREERLVGVHLADEGIDRNGVDGPVVKQTLRPRPLRVPNIACFTIENNGDVVGDIGDGAFESDDARRAPHEVKAQVGFEGADEISRYVYNLLAECQGPRGIPVDERRKPVRIRIQSNADQTFLRDPR